MARFSFPEAREIRPGRFECGCMPTRMRFMSKCPSPSRSRMREDRAMAHGPADGADGQQGTKRRNVRTQRLSRARGGRSRHRADVRDNQLIWLHRNERSYFPSTLEVQRLTRFADKYPDPLLHRTFGCLMRGPDLTAIDNLTLQSAKPATQQRLAITVHLRRPPRSTLGANNCRRTQLPTTRFRWRTPAPTTDAGGKVFGIEAGSTSVVRAEPTRLQAATRCSVGWRRARGAGNCR